MGDMMQFQERWEDFLRDYEFEDSKKVYTNGSMLIPSFRVEQMMEHYAQVRHGRWDGGYTKTSDGEWVYSTPKCTVCGSKSNGGTTNFCPYCGADMRGGGGDA